LAGPKAEKMAKSIKSITLETAFGAYVVDINDVLGEGGAGRVYGGRGPDQKQVAIKVLSADKATSDKRRRFKNEIAFLQRNTHPNIVTVIDSGFAREGKVVGPFYVMPRYSGSLRVLMQQHISTDNVLPLFLKILDGVEAAHLQGVVHRDLKPENVLHDAGELLPVVADFGIAHFTDDLLVTQVETSPTQRLANFLYAAPEQRRVGGPVGQPADIYALGLILNEMFTGSVPHGTEFPPIKHTAPQLGYLDDIVAKMLRQNPSDRPSSIADIKSLFQRHQSELISIQRLSSISGTVIRTDEIDEPLAQEAPRLVNYDWDGYSTLKLILDRPVSTKWVLALHNMGNYGYVMGKPPSAFKIKGNEATIPARENEIQDIINYFKPWLPAATRVLKQTLEQEAQKAAYEKREKLRIEREIEEAKLRVLNKVIV